MSNFIRQWWRSRRFRHALKRGDTKLAKQIFKEIEEARAGFSLLEKQFRKQLQAEQDAKSRVHENVTLRQKLQHALHQVETLEKKQHSSTLASPKLNPDSGFINLIRNQFNIIERDRYTLQAMGIDEGVFGDFEHRLALFLKKELKKQNPQNLKLEIEKARQDLESGDPHYNLKLSSHLYLIKSFLDNVYCSYLAWFLIYQAGLLPQNPKILDIAAGPSTVAFSLNLLLRSGSQFLEDIQPHISYYSLEKQALLQFRGLQLWRQYIEPEERATNIYFRFKTTDFLKYEAQDKKIPQSFFDFIVVSHCFFSDSDRRSSANLAYKQIFKDALSPDGLVLLIVQGEKLFSLYEKPLNEDRRQEQDVIEKFLEDLGLKLTWYKYLTSSGQRQSVSSDFVEKNLPPQKYIHAFKTQYLKYQSPSHYTVEDYAILGSLADIPSIS
ncbi:photosystem II assembly protein [Lusitaniella coriacea]|uniref:photosystem II assembly protein n=1 Tax=Lusitaniella coriacea TaxID=1983105 RepID=UPI003CEFA3BF